VDERIYQIGLSMLNGIGPLRAKSLVALLGSSEAVFRESDRNLSQLEGFGKKFVRELDRKSALSRAESELEFIEKNNIQSYYYQDQGYSLRLKNAEDGPVVLYAMGALDFRPKSVAVVGTRSATSYGRKMTELLIEGLAPHGVQIVSGLAHGIDKSAHEAALSNGLQTIGVLGHGLDTMYPAAHRNLAKRMLQNGGLVTEFASKTQGDPGNFPRRNRIVAGLSDAVVVIESSVKGGSMITANLANDYDRECFAFPGPVDRESSAGCNNLIKRNKAHLITSAEDLIEIMAWQEQSKKNTHVQAKIFAAMSPEEEKLVEILRDGGELDVDKLAHISKMMHGVLSFHLFNLEMNGLIRALPGKRYGLI